MQIDVLGKTPEQVADEIIAALGSDFNGGVLVLVGLSGTGESQPHEHSVAQHYPNSSM